MLVDQNNIASPSGLHWNEISHLIRLMSMFPVSDSFQKEAQHVSAVIERLEKCQEVFDLHYAYVYMAAREKMMWQLIEKQDNMRDPDNVMRVAACKAMYTLYGHQQPLCTNLDTVVKNLHGSLSEANPDFADFWNIIELIHHDHTRYADLDHLRSDLIKYISAIRASKLDVQRRSDIIAACCFALSLFH